MRRPKTVCVAFAIGCPRNQMDTAWLSRYFEVNGCKLVRHARNADLVVAATCGFSAQVEEESVRLLSLLDKKRRRDSQLVVVGCLAGINAARAREEFGAIAIAPADISQFDQLIDADIPLKDVPPVNCMEPRVFVARSGWSVREMYPTIGAVAALKHQTKRVAYALLSQIGTERFAIRTLRRFRSRSQDRAADPVFFIRIARGCLEECSYCAIRQAAGVLRSKPLEDVLAEFDLGLAQKHTRFEILAEDIGPYGLDIGSTCIELFEQLFKRQGTYDFVVTDLNARYLIRYTPTLSDIFAAHSDRIRLLRVPVQSGSDRILEQMRRCYTSTEAREALGYLRKKAPNIRTSTHILIGFPGETDEDFEDTMNLLRSVRFDEIQVYSYTDRPNTSASALTDKVATQIKQQRIRRLLREFPQAEECVPTDKNEACEAV